MYTQCPDCSTAFRVTAEVLKQATGKVRCGGCGIAFNALEHLSEEKPQSRFSHEREPPRPPPELRPDPPDDDSEDSPLQSISPEQSAALLKTLDELAGEDIRLEDTGVEWRVLSVDDEDTLTEDPDPESDTSDHAETGSLKFFIEDDELPTESDERDEPRGDADPEPDDQPSAFDEFLEQLPSQDEDKLESPDLFHSSEPQSSMPADEMRFDDDTPLPDDFGFNDELLPSTESGPGDIDAPPPATEDEDADIDLALSDPDEWEDLLGEVGQAASAPARDDLVAAEAADVDAPHAIPVDDDNTAISDSDDVPPDVDTQFALQAEAMGISPTGTHRVLAGDAVIDADAFADDQDRDHTEDITLEAIDADDIEQSGAFEFDSIADDPAIGTEDKASLDAALFTLTDDEDNEAVDVPETDTDDDEDVARIDVLETDIDDDEDVAGIDVLETDIDDDEDSSIDDELIAAAFEAESALKDSRVAAAAESAAEPESTAEHFVPPQTEEEKTINMMIDQDLMRLAAESDNGVSPSVSAKRPDTAENSMVETIVMEGDFVRNALEREHREQEMSVAVAAPATRFMTQAARTISGSLRGGRRKTDPPSYSVISGVVALVLLLGLQFAHQSREALATVPAFNQVVGPVYRMLGQPLTPAWDVAGWRFEVTKGSTDDYEDVLTIYSRIGNNSKQALPYPLVHVSLTDRFEEIIGSRVLEPNEYLIGNADPRKPVGAGNSFNAVISIESPSPEAIGFKLNVCYRLTGGQLRCAIEDFK